MNKQKGRPDMFVGEILALFSWETGSLKPADFLWLSRAGGQVFRECVFLIQKVKHIDKFCHLRRKKERSVKMTDCHHCGTEKQLSKVRYIFQSPGNMSNSEVWFAQYHVSTCRKVQWGTDCHCHKHYYFKNLQPQIVENCDI